MAFPTVVNTASSQGVTGSPGTATPTMPTSIVSNNLLLAFCAIQSSGGLGAITGYTELGEVDKTSGNSSSFGAYVRKATATSADNVSFSGFAAQWAAIVYQINGWSGTLSDCKWVGSGATTNTLTPPALTPGFGSLDYLWIAAALNWVTITAAPSGFSGLVTKQNTGSGYFIGTGQLAATASSETPGAFTGTATSASAQLMSINPVAAATSLPPSLFVPNSQAVARSYFW